MYVTNLFYASFQVASKVSSRAILHRIFKTVVNKTEGLDGVYCKVLRTIF